MAAQLSELRDRAGETSVHHKAVAEHFFRGGQFFRNPVIEKLIATTPAFAETLATEGSRWNGPGLDKTSLAKLGNSEAAMAFRRLQAVFDEFADYLVVEPRYLTHGDTGEPKYPYSMNRSSEVLALLFLSNLRRAFPETERYTPRNTSQALQHLRRLKDRLGEFGLTQDEYEAAAPKVYAFFDELGGLGENASNDRKQALLKTLAKLFPPLTAERRAMADYERAEATLREKTAEFDAQEERGTTLRTVWTTRQFRNNRALGKFREEVATLRKKHAEAATELQKFHDELAAQTGMALVLHPSVPPVNPELSAKVDQLTHETTADAASSPHLEAARREIRSLDKLRDRFFSPRGLFGLAPVEALKGTEVTPEAILEKMQEALKPPALTNGATAFGAKHDIERWQFFLDRLNVTEADYLRLVEDLRALAGDEGLKERVLSRLAREWHSDFAELESLRKMAFGESAPAPDKAALTVVPSTSAKADSVQTVPVARDAVGIYLDTVTLWSQEFNSLSREMLSGPRDALAKEAKAVATEVAAAVRRGKVVDANRISLRLNPKISVLVAELDKSLPKLARLHGEGLQVQYGLNDQFKLLQKAAEDRRKAVLDEAESLPEWQQDVALRQLERGETRLQTIGKIKLSFDRTMASSATVEQAIEKSRDAAVDLNLFLQSQAADPGPMSGERAKLLIELLNTFNP